ncbi:Glp-like protein [Desarmillaria tabescens]|uniref:Glp-like protein n=1 Tax=Armillaria tabescens TaxID=1929756 RepID=A0AA39MQW8_ARMTA|nr:Glp-like protein [Desarmillaria tabescens]KAK0442520.1 Glp-like protein [Desarmillaria tabescens]
MFARALLFVAFITSGLISDVQAESHTVKMVNNCGTGTPTLSQNFNVLSTGADYTVTGPFESAIAWLETDDCAFNGRYCTLVEITLKNPTAPGAGSSVDLSIIEPNNVFNVPASFSYFNGCDGEGKSCNSSDCTDAFHKATDWEALVQCEVDDVGIIITFC